MKNGKAAYERDSVLFKKIQHNYPLLSVLFRAAIENNNSINLIDFGGSLGTTYYQCRVFLKDLTHISWNIVEQENFVKCGSQYFQDDILKFYYSIDECLKNEKHKQNLILLSSVIGYMENPYKLLTDIISYNFKYIVIDRTYFSEGNDDLISIQYVPKEIYKASYPHWFLSKSKFIRILLKNGYRLLCDWIPFVHQSNEYLYNGLYKCEEKGMLFEKIK